MKSLFAVGAFVVATVFSPMLQAPASKIAQDYLESEPEVAKIFGIGISWLAIYVIVNIIVSFIIKETEKTPLKIFDRMAGLILGLVMSIIVVTIPLLITKSIPIIKQIPQVKTAMHKSILLPMFEPFTAPFSNFFMEALREQREEIMKKMSDKYKNEMKKLQDSQKKKAIGKEEEIKKIMKDYDIKGLDNKDGKKK